MRNENPNDEQVLRDLGQRLRDGNAEKNPAQERDLKLLKDPVRQKRPERDAEKEPEHKAPEPMPER